jgi:hypothetical protein
MVLISILVAVRLSIEKTALSGKRPWCGLWSVVCFAAASNHDSEKEFVFVFQGNNTSSLILGGAKVGADARGWIREARENLIPQERERERV